MEYYVESENTSLSEYGIEFFLQHPTIKGFSARSHIHPSVEFILIRDGNYSIRVDGTETEAHPGDLLLFRANAIHDIKFTGSESGSYYVLKISPSLLFHIFPGHDQKRFTAPFLLKSRNDISHFDSSSIPSSITEIWSKMISVFEHRSDTFFISERIYASLFLLEMLKILPQTKYSNNDSEVNEKTVLLIFKSVDYINKNYASDITARECAEKIHLSYSYFARLFHTIMGKTFKEYLVTVRLDKARSILLSTDIPITDVASLCGYSNLSYFISEYRKSFRKTPGDERRIAVG